mgnify:CR=1 FL=1
MGFGGFFQPPFQGKGAEIKSIIEIESIIDENLENFRFLFYYSYSKKAVLGFSKP